MEARIKYLVCMFYLLILYPVNAQPLSSCGVIDFPGYYTLANNITNNSASVCFWIWADNVTIDGNGHVLEGSYSGIGIIIGSAKNRATNITIKNITVKGWYVGISVRQGENVRILNTIVENASDSISLGDPLNSSSGIIIDNCTLRNSTNYGINIGYNVENITIKNSVIVHSSSGISYGGNYYYPNITVYNNFFNTTAKSAVVAYYVTFNTTKRAGINIIGGNYIGGNYWGRTDGSGFSDTCIDSDRDGICDSPYPINSMSYDYLPLAGAGARAGPPPIEEYPLSGAIYYSGNKSGTIYIEVLYSCDPFAAPLYFTNISSPGNYSINVTNGSYYVRAFMDANGNSSYDAGEPYGVAINKSGCADADLINISNTGVSLVDITLYEAESTPPLVYILSPQNRSYNTSNIYIEVSATDDTGVDSVIAELDGANITLSYSAGLYTAAASGLADGIHHLRIYANDTFGNVNATEEVYFSVDTAMPSIAFVAPTPANGTLMNSLNATWIYINVTANEPLSSAWLEYWNENLHVNISLNGSAKNWYGNFSPMNGAFYYRAWGNDSAGNLNSTEIRFIKIDAQPPNITIYSPQNKTYNTSSVALNVSANEAISAWWYSLDGGANVSFTPNTTLSNLSESMHRLTVYARDSAGNTANADVVFSITLSDTTPPNLTFVAPTPANGSTITNYYVFINITSNEPLSQALLEFNRANYTMYGSGRNWYRNFTLYTPGYYQVSFRVYGKDTAGNWGTTEERSLNVEISKISGCAVIGYPGVYRLAKDIVNSSASTCIWIIASDVHLEGDGHLIDGVGNPNSRGIYIFNTTGALRNVTIRNLILSDWSYGVDLFNVSQARAENISGVNNTLGAKIALSQNISLERSSLLSAPGGDGVFVYGAGNITLAQNMLSNCAFCIKLSASADSMVENNTIIPTTGGYGVYLYSSSGNVVSGNLILNGTYGAYIESSRDNLLVKNNLSNSQYGVYYINSSNERLTQNSFYMQQFGIYAHNSSYLRVENNTANLADFLHANLSDNMWIINNTAIVGDDALGIYSSNYLEIDYNNFIGSSAFSTGIYMEESNSSTVHSNKIVGFEFGVELYHSYSNMFYNNLLNNSLNVLTGGQDNKWNITKTLGTNIIGGPYLGGNFWAKPDGSGFSETCIDSDGDGICDSPYILGTYAADYLPLTFEVKPPEINIISPQSRNYTSPPPINVSAMDLSGISLVKAEIDGSNITLSFTNGYYTASLSSLWAGRHLLRIYAWDTLGNLNSSHVVFSIVASQVKAEKNVSSGERAAVNETLGNTSVELEIAPLVNDTITVIVNESTNVSQLASTTNKEFSAYATAKGASSIDKFVSIEVNGSSINNTANLSYVIVKLHYSIADLDKNGDGDYNDPGDIDPRTLHLYRYCPDTKTWDEIPHGPGWVCGNVEVFNSSVNTSANYVWANLSHLSVFGIAGSVIPPPPAQAPPPAGGVYSPEAVILANSIDLALASEFIDYLRENGIKLYIVQASNFSEYARRGYIIILGGHRAYEGVGDIVSEILTEKEKEEVERGSVFIKKRSVFRSGGVVYIFAGRDRKATAEAWEKRYVDVVREIRYNWG